MFKKQRTPMQWLLTAWLFLSSGAIVWHLIPVFADYQQAAERQKALEAEYNDSPEAVITVPDGSRWPNATLKLQGHSVRGLDDNELSVASLSFGQRNRLIATRRQIFVMAHDREWQLLRQFPSRQHSENLFQGALSGDGKVVATLGEFPQICFWDVANETLLQTIDEEKILPVAEPDQSSRSAKHHSGMRYSNTDVRKVVAAPGGCLFAVGKVDGTVELWSAADQPLPDRPNGFVTPKWPHRPDDRSPAPKRFQRLVQIRPHEGRVEDMAFTPDCQSLLVTFGRVFDGMKEAPREDNTMPSVKYPSYRSADEYLILCLNVAKGEVYWQQKSRRPPSLLAMDAGSLNLEGLLHPPRFAVLTSSDELQIRSLNDGSVLSEFSVQASKPRADIQAMSFDPTGSLLLTVDRQYTADPDRHSVTHINAWSIHDRTRLVSAEIPGQVMNCSWSPYGHHLAMQLLLNKPDRGEPPRGFSTPFGRRSSFSPFRLHVWDVNVVLDSTHKDSNPTEL